MAGPHATRVGDDPPQHRQSHLRKDSTRKTGRAAAISEPGACDWPNETKTIHLFLCARVFRRYSPLNVKCLDATHLHGPVRITMRLTTAILFEIALAFVRFNHVASRI